MANRSPVLITRIDREAGYQNGRAVTIFPAFPGTVLLTTSAIRSVTGKSKSRRDLDSICFASRLDPGPVNLQEIRSLRCLPQVALKSWIYRIAIHRMDG